MFDAQSDFQFLAVPGEKSARPILHPAAKSRRDAIKAAGGADYEALLAKERVSRAKFRRERPGASKCHRNSGGLFTTALCAKARQRGRKRGMEATITAADLHWPTHCPVLGLALDYPERSGMRKGLAVQPNWPSLDRWDSSKGYVPGNVFVISYRANTLKNSATYAEILKVAKYLSKRPR